MFACVLYGDVYQVTGVGKKRTVAGKMDDMICGSATFVFSAGHILNHYFKVATQVFVVAL